MFLHHHKLAHTRKPLMFKFILFVFIIVAATDATAIQSGQHETKPLDANVWEPSEGLKQIPIWPNGAPNMEKTTLSPETTQFKKPPEVQLGREYIQILNVSEPTMTIYPPKGENTGATIVVFPGGGFRYSCHRFRRR